MLGIFVFGKSHIFEDQEFNTKIKLNVYCQEHLKTNLHELISGFRIVQCWNVISLFVKAKFIDSTPPTYSIINRLNLGFMNVRVGELWSSKRARKIVGILPPALIAAIMKLNYFADFKLLYTLRMYFSYLWKFF